MKFSDGSARRGVITSTSPKSIWGVKNFNLIQQKNSFENKISSYELEVMTRTCTNIFGDIFSPCAHCGQTSKSDDKWPRKSGFLAHFRQIIGHFGDKTHLKMPPNAFKIPPKLSNCSHSQRNFSRTMDIETRMYMLIILYFTIKYLNYFRFNRN